MLKWAVVLALVSLTVSLLGFSDLSSDATGVAGILFCVFLVMFVAVMLIGLLNSRIAEQHRRS